jgi:hypothetical protein
MDTTVASHRLYAAGYQRTGGKMVFKESDSAHLRNRFTDEAPLALSE